MNTRKANGFTLIEILVVIGILAILATIVLVAVNPARQFKLARDSQRTSNVSEILNAIHENISEHQGSFVCNGNITVLPSAFTVIRSASSTSPGASADIALCLVPDYLAALPFDPSIPGSFYTSTTSYDTNYEISVDSDGRITASSTGELTPTISVTR